AAERDALEDPEHNQERWPQRAGLGVGRKEADQEGCAAHQADRDEEGALAAKAVADHSEDECAQGPEGETCREKRQRRDLRGGRIEPREEDLGNDRREAAENEEIVPFERGTRG